MRPAAAEKARRAEDEKARLAADRANKADQEKAAAAAKAAEDARLAAEKAKQIENAKAAAAEQRRKDAEAAVAKALADKQAAVQKLGIEAMATDAWLSRTTLTPSWSRMRPGSCPFTISHVSGAIACKSRASILQQDRRRQVPPRTPCCAANASPSAEPRTPAQLLRFMFNFTF
ncbi:hypothetical protein [Bradyrhizobium betae]|uniref:hypothetical protein n=1 Tax=Bradyrhizobium betae TaxID=244734 RepID=UPI0024BF1915|nr:hypothetical protein [Bradyrhizobium betae]